MEIVRDVPSGGTEELRGAGPTHLDLVGRPIKFVTDGVPLDLSVACVASGVLVVRVARELDMLTAPLLDQCLQEQVAKRPAHLVVDLAAVDFMGSAGLNTLLTARERAQTAGVMLHLTGMTTRAVVRPLEVTGLLPLFTVYPTLTDALGELTRERGGAVNTGWSLTDAADTG